MFNPPRQTKWLSKVPPEIWLVVTFVIGLVTYRPVTQSWHHVTHPEPPHAEDICFADPNKPDIRKVPERDDLYVSDAPLTAPTGFVGSLDAGEQVNVEAYCETPSGTDLKIKSVTSGVEGYIPAHLLDAWILNPGTEIMLLQPDVELFVTAQNGTVTKQVLDRWVHIVVLEGPHVADYISYKVRVKDSQGAIGWMHYPVNA
jgi:hypothetical protein